jgi:serine/threonine protein kinase
MAYEEYCRRLEAGEQLDPAAFCARFPAAVQDSLALLIHVHNLLPEELKKAEAETPVSWPSPGDTFLGFVLRRQLGKGAFARVFLATESALGDRLVVVKVSRRGTGEAATLGRLQHANVVPVHSVQKDPQTGLTAICMPYLGAATLDHVLERTHADPSRSRRARVILEAAAVGALDMPGEGQQAPVRLLRRGDYLEGVCHLAAQLADALAFIHAQGICHQDLKPSNVLLTPDGRPMLLDFNLSRDTRGGERLVGGTVPYMSPEQLQALYPESGQVPLPPDAPADVFSLGVIVYQLLAGTLPFGPIPPGLSESELSRVMLHRQLGGPYPLRVANPSVNGSLAELVERCLAFESHSRQGAAELAAAFRRALAPLPRLRRCLGRRPWTAIASVLLALSLAGGGAWTYLHRDPPGMAQLRHGWIALHQGDHLRAVEHFNQALEADDNLAEALFGRGRARQQLGDPKSLQLALDDFSAAYQKTKDSKLLACKGYCFDRLGGRQEAAAEYHKALAAGFNRAEVHNNLAFGLLRAHKLEQARQCLDRALAIDAGLAAAYHNRAWLNYNQATTLCRPAAAGTQAGLQRVVAWL